MTLLMSYGADILVILASLGAMAYCMVLSRRLSRLTSFDKGLGSAIAVMSSQVDEMKAALHEAKSGSDGAGHHLRELVDQARELSSELEMMIAACHDFAEVAISVQTPDPAAPADDPAQSEAAMPSQDSADVVPVFGSRRSAATEEPENEQQPLFPHRAAASAAAG